MDLTNLSKIEQKKFEAMVHHNFRDRVVGLKEFVTLKDATNTKAVQFQTYGQLDSQERKSVHTEIPVSDTDKDPITVVVRNFTVRHMTDVFAEGQVNFSDKKEAAIEVGEALERRLEQLMIDAVTNASGIGKTAKNISGANAPLTLDAIQDAAAAFDEEGVPEEGRCWWAGEAPMRAHLGWARGMSPRHLSSQGFKTILCNRYMGC